MKIEIKNQLILTDIKSPGLADNIKKNLTMLNPAYAEAEKMRRWTGNITKKLFFWNENGDGLTVPRGFLHDLNFLAARHGEPVQIIDNRRTLPPVDFHFSGKLRPYQVDAMNQAASLDESTLSAPTGSGKTVIGLAIIAERRQRTLIIVPTRELMEQWKERSSTFLGIPREEIGQIGGGKMIIGEKITVGIINSVYPIAPDISSHFGHVIVDECHRCPSRTFTQALTAFDARYILGLSATPYRRDGLSKLITWFCGPLVEIDAAEVKAAGGIIPAQVTMRESYFRPQVDPATDYSRALAELTEDPNRTAKIARDVAQEAKTGAGICLCLTDRKKHAEALAAALERHHQSSEVLTGDSPAAKRAEIVNKLNSGRVKVLIATGQLIGEGFDCRGLEKLFLTTPISFEGRIIQYIGRILRPAPGKFHAEIFDYIDSHGVFRAAARKRQEIYLKNNWRIYGH